MVAEEGESPRHQGEAVQVDPSLAERPLAAGSTQWSCIRLDRSTVRSPTGKCTVYEFLQVDASAHIKMEPCMQPNLFYCDFYQYFMKLKEYSLKSENLED